MFFIMGISNGEKKLQMDQLAICPRCDKYGRIEVYVTYMYFMFFFIPLFKWNKRYVVKMNCCHVLCDLPTEVGQEIEKGIVRKLDVETLDFEQNTQCMKICNQCGFKTEEDFQYCPKCGHSL